jgi:glycosyltransferase involved in cell wall biosynthesis
MKKNIVHLVWHYPVVCQTPKEDFFKICRDAVGGDIVSVKGAGVFSVLKRIWGKEVHAQGRGFPFPEMASLFSKKSIYTPHSNTIGSSKFTRFVRRFIINRYDRIVCQTEYGRKTFIAQGIRKEKITVIPSAVDFGFFSKAKGGGTFRKKHGLGRKPFALCIGIRPVKNPLTIAKACEKAGVKAVMVGPYTNKQVDSTWKDPGFDWYLPPAELKGMKNVELVGQLSPEELLSALDAATVFVHSSDYESFGLVVYEAAAAGLPLCLPDFETFDCFRGCALFHKPKDAGQLAENIKKYISDPRLRKSNGRMAQQVAENVDYPHVRRMYSEFYKSWLPDHE